MALNLAEHVENRVEAARGEETHERLRLTVVLLRWDAEEASRASAQLDRRLGALSGIDVHRYLVDNASAAGEVTTGGDGWVHVPGDNRAREFSGLQRGISQAAADGVRTDIWLFANDRFPTWSYRFESHLSSGTVRVAAALPGVVGRVDSYPGPVASFGLQVSPWVNTSFYLVPDEVLRPVGGPVIVGPDEMEEVLPSRWPGPGDPFPPTGPVGAVHAHHIVSFLGHRTDAPHGAHWYRRLDPDEANWAEFRAKVMSVLNEQLFSARAGAAGVPLVDMALAHRLGRLGVDNPAVRAVMARMRVEPESEPWSQTRVLPRLRLDGAALAAASRPRRRRTPVASGS